MSDEPKLLRIPTSFHSVEDVLETARKMNLPNVLVLAEMENGNLVFLGAPDLSLSATNWLLDRMKYLMLEPNSFERQGP